MPFLAYLLNMALEDANNEKNSRPLSSGKRHKLLPVPLQPAGEV